jgi:hypothetical protein
MTTTFFPLPRQGRTGLLLVFGAFLLATKPGTAPAQSLPDPPPVVTPPDLNRAPIVPPDLLLSPSAASASSSTSGQGNRLRLFRIQPGFLSDPVGLDSDDKPGTDSRLPVPEPDSGPDWLTLSAGNDNPYFDFRRRDDPGGVGYTKVSSQVQLFDTSKTACSVGLQAVTPAGLQSDGLPDKLGTTVMTPAVSLFHTLDDATGVQAFVGMNVPVINSGPQTINRDLQYGLAIHRPLTTASNDPLSGVYVSVGALGQMRMSDPTTNFNSNVRIPPSWEVLPGLHYKVADNWWISGAVVLPVGTQQTTTSSTLQQWQVTCSFQF